LFRGAGGEAHGLVDEPAVDRLGDCGERIDLAQLYRRQPQAFCVLGHLDRDARQSVLGLDRKPRDAAA
jgi:hypothetical protein